MNGGADRTALSIVISNHNYGRFLAEAVETALSQGDQTEVVVVDDGSTDDSREVIARLDPRVRTILQANGGQASAFNAGFAATRGRVVVFLDADDLLERDLVDTLGEALAAGAVHAHWQMQLADAQGRPTGGLRPARPGQAGDLRAAVARVGPAFLRVTPTSGNAFSRAFLETALPMPTGAYRNGGGDLYLTWLAAASGAVVAVNRPLSRYRRHGSNDNTSGSTDERIDRGLAWARQGLAAVADRLDLEHSVLTDWSGREWWHQAEAVRCATRRHVPPDARVLVVDDHLWALRDSFADRPVTQLAADHDDGLVTQLDRALADGTAHLVVPAFCSWWFEHYPRWAERVRAVAVATHRDAAATIVVLGGRS